MKFKLTGSLHYAPVIFEEDDITVAISTALNVEGEVSIWNEEMNTWDWLYLAGEETEMNLECLERYGVNEEKRKMCTYARGRDNVLISKTDDYFLMGAGVIDLVIGKVTDRHKWDSHSGGNFGKKLPNCNLSKYGLYPEQGKMDATDPDGEYEEFPDWFLE